LKANTKMVNSIPNKTALFNPLSGHIEQLFGYIDLGDLGLPDLQRPFVWSNSKVRDLFDSLYKGYPIGSYLLWRNSNLNGKTHHIGTDKKEHDEPNLLIIDGQQRLTALYSVFRDRFVKDENYQDRKIVISFNPVTEEFKVADASTERNLEFINNISELFTKSSTRTFINNYLAELKSHQESMKQKREEIILKISENKDLNKADISLIIDRIKAKDLISEEEKIIIEKLENEEETETLTEKEYLIVKDVLIEENTFDEEKISNRIEKLYNLKNYPFNALEIVPDINEEQVADIFTRVNSKGTVLKQADFILTLLSVFWEDGRKEIDSFCKDCLIQPNKKEKESPFNHIIEPMPNDIIRTIAGLGFSRGKMKDVYAILTGRDFSTKKVSKESREKQFQIFKDNQKIVLDNTNWHGFLKILMGLGFKSKDLVSSSNNIINAYILYLIGKTKWELDYKELEDIIGKWFFFASVTSRYSYSPESQMDSDLNSIKNVKNKAEYISILKDMISNELTNDFWEITLPNRLLVSSSSNSPARNIYFACLIKNGTKVLFSNRTVSDLFDPSMKLKKKSLEKHHIFPRNYLKEKFDLDKKQINQIANFTYLEFEDNINISDEEPKKYYFEMKNNYFQNKEDVLNKMLREHCLPNEFYNLEYQEFLKERRKLIAKLIRETYEKL